MPPSISRRQALRHGLMAPAAALASWPALGQYQPQSPVSYRIFESGRDTHAFAREMVRIADHPDHQYQLFTAVPRRSPPPGGFPVIYMLDGNSVFDRLEPADLAAASGLVIVGVGYPNAHGFDLTGRTRDYTPPPGADAGKATSATPRDLPSGGAPLFQQLLSGPLRAVAERDLLQGVALDAQRRALWGHSYGGLYALYSLLTRPASFQRYCAISPSTTWGGHLLSQLARQRRTHAVQADVLVMLGDRETRADGRGAQTPSSPAPNPATLALVNQLRHHPGLRVASSVLEGLGHGATFTASLQRSFALAQG